ncbi:MAG TPA: metal ABC transporter substrate-binding protein [Candidatus Acidoferrales bacterium]|nr:metal ABC transporter substrate-binding protein [Candidatus Acidoferrales bacterium]
MKRLVAVLLAGSLAACSSAKTATAVSGPIPVVTTISTFNSLVQGVGGDLVHVQSIVPVGASPEDYEPTPQDAVTLSQAKILVENGAGLETWLAPLLKNVPPAGLHVVVGAAGLQVKNKNPHLWMNPENAKVYVAKIRDALIAVDPAHAEQYRRNAITYQGKLEALSSWIGDQIQTIPPSRRYMIVFHNAWQYYNDRYGITTLGFIEANPGQDPNPQQVAHLVDLARSHHVGAIFSEPEYSKKLADQIASGAGVRVVTDLYDDSIGTNPDVGDYISMLTYDTNVIVRALK